MKGRKGRAILWVVENFDLSVLEVLFSRSLAREAAAEYRAQGFVVRVQKFVRADP